MATCGICKQIVTSITYQICAGNESLEICQDCHQEGIEVLSGLISQIKAAPPPAAIAPEEKAALRLRGWSVVAYHYKLLKDGVLECHSGDEESLWRQARYRQRKADGQAIIEGHGQAFE